MIISGAYILMRGTIKEQMMLQKKHIKDKIFINFAPFDDSISKINNTKLENIKDLDVVMLIFNLIEYNDNSSIHKIYVPVVTLSTQANAKHATIKNRL